MFMPNAIVVDAGSTVRLINPSNLPHNVVGIFNQTTAQDAVNSTGLIIDNSTDNTSNNNTNANNTQSSPQSSSSGAIAIDSGFIPQGQSWQYGFNELGVFNYLCTIHAEEGVRGTLHHPVLPCYDNKDSITILCIVVISVTALLLGRQQLPRALHC